MKIELQKQVVLDPGMQQAHQKVERAQQPPSPQKELIKLNQEELKELSHALSEFLSIFNLEVKLVYHKEAGQIVVQVIDKRTNEVIKQIPPEELLRIAKKIHDFVGLLLEKKA